MRFVAEGETPRPHAGPSLPSPGLGGRAATCAMCNLKAAAGVKRPWIQTAFIHIASKLSSGV